MAEYFLKKIPEYDSWVKEGIISMEQNERLKILTNHLQDDYKIVEGTSQEVYYEVSKQIKEIDLKYDKTLFNLDLQYMGCLFRWLVEENKQVKDEILKSNHHLIAPIVGQLQQHDILFWKDLEANGKLSSKDFNFQSTVDEISKLTQVVFEAMDDINRRITLITKAYQKTEKEKAQLIKQLAKSEKSALDWQDKFEELQKEIDPILEENDKLKEQASRTSQFENLVFQMQQLIPNGQAVMENSHELPIQEHMASTEDMVSEDPQLAKLPLVFTWKSPTGAVEYSGTMEYSQYLIEDFHGYNPEKQRKIIAGVKKLCEHGMTYPSLNVKKFEEVVSHCPTVDMFSMRADQFVRVIFQKTDNKITFYRALDKNDAAVAGGPRRA